MNNPQKSKWDVPPTPAQQALDQQASALTNFAATDFSGPALESGLPQQTRHARRLYLGNLPPGLTEQEVHDFFLKSINDALDTPLQEDPLLSVYINHERRFCFLEFKSVEMTQACLELDGIDILGRGKVTVKRPNDYNPTMAPPVHPSQLPKLDVAKLGIVSTTVADGPHKIFIGGLHYHLQEDQILELLGAFGKVKAFHLVKNDDLSGQNYSKGYGFCQYADPNVTSVAIQGLNGMDLGGGKTLTARVAAVKDGAGAMAAATAAPGGANMIGGYNVEELVDAAMGLRPMPTAPSYSAAAPTMMMNMPNIPPQAPPQAYTTTTAASLPPPPPSQAAAVDIANAALEAAFPTGNPPPPTHQDAHVTRILVLLNMVTDQDLSSAEDYQGLTDEVRMECAKFGSLLSMKIPRPLEGYEPSAIKKIFLEYATPQDASTAQRELAGRSFGENVVVATFFSEQDYLENKLR